MDEEQNARAAESLRRAQEVLEQTAGVRDDLARRRARAAEWGSASDGFHHPPEPAPPTQRAPQRAPAPPSASRVTIPIHSKDGRIQSAQVFEGMDARAATDWAGYIEERIGARLSEVAPGIGEAIAEIVKQAEQRLAKENAKLAAQLKDTVDRLATLSATIQRLDRGDRAHRLDDDVERTGLLN